MDSPHFLTCHRDRAKQMIYALRFSTEGRVRTQTFGTWRRKQELSLRPQEAHRLEACELDTNTSFTFCLSAVDRLPGLGSVSSDDRDSKTFEMVSAGLH